MDKSKQDVIIVGGGLGGLTLAYLLKHQGIRAKILESRPRLGGRTLTSKTEDMAPIELGATWCNRSHTALLSLLKALKVGTFEQRMDSKVFYEPFPQSAHQLVQVPPNNDPSFRIIGGTTAMIDALAHALDPKDIFCDTTVTHIKKLDDHIEIQTNQEVYTADIVISTLPPNLLNTSILFEPALPEKLMLVASQTHTWMSESIKIGLRYKQPFWRENGSSGTIFSNVGPITEFYDHSNYEDKLYALKGFIKDEYSKVSKAERLEAIMKQLQRFYGEQTKDYISYEETVWRAESFTHKAYKESIAPHQNNGHPIYNTPFYDGKFFVAGSETATHFGGYMEGAVRSAMDVSKLIIG